MLTHVPGAKAELDPGITRGKLLRDLGAIIRRGIVYDEDSNILYALPIDAVDAGLQEPPVVVVGNCDIDAGHLLI